MSNAQSPPMAVGQVTPAIPLMSASMAPAAATGSSQQQAGGESATAVSGNRSATNMAFPKAATSRSVASTADESQLRIHDKPKYYKLECKEQNRDREMLDRLLAYHQTKGYESTLRVVGGWLRDKILGTKRETVNLNILIPFNNAEEYAKGFQEYLDTNHQQRTALRVTRQGLAILEEPEWKLVVDFFPMKTNAAGMPDPLEDVKAKDFTINAMYWELEINRIVDYCDGIKDLNAHILRCPIAAKDAIAQNPLRAFRAVRFLSCFTGNQDFIADVSLVDTLGKSGPGLKQYLMDESAFPEWEKVFADRRINMTKFCSMMAQHSLLDSLFDMSSAVAAGIRKDRLWVYGVRCVQFVEAALTKLYTSKTCVILPAVAFPGSTIFRDMRRFRATELGTLFLACLLGGVPTGLRSKKVERYLSLQSTVVTEILDMAKFPPPVTPKVILIQNLGEDMLNILLDPVKYGDFAAVRMRVHREEGCDETWEYAAVYAAVQHELISRTPAGGLPNLTKQQLLDMLSQPLEDDIVDSIDQKINILYNAVIRGNRPKIYTLAWEPHGEDENVLNHMTSMMETWEAQDKLVLRVSGGWVKDKFLGYRREHQKMDIYLEVSEIDAFAAKVAEYFTEVVALPDVGVSLVGPEPDAEAYKYQTAYRITLPSYKITLDIMSLRSSDPAYVGTAYQDAKLKDYTICALFWNTEIRRIEDHVGGVADIRSRTLRCCTEDALGTLMASSERLFRGLHLLCAHPDLHPDGAFAAVAPKAASAVAKATQAGMYNAHLERLFQEKRAQWGREFSLMAQWNLLDAVFDLPEVVTAKISADKIYGAGLRSVQYVQQIWRRLNSNETIVQMGWETIFRKKEKCSFQVAGTLFLGAFLVALPLDSITGVLEGSLKLYPAYAESVDCALRWSQAAVKAMNPKEEASRISRSGVLESIMKNPEVTGQAGMSEVIILLSTVIQEMMAKGEFKAFSRSSGAKLPVTDFEKEDLDSFELKVAANYDRMRKSFRPKAYNLAWPPHNNDSVLFKCICDFMESTGESETHKVRVVGGWMRDKILGIKRDISDISFVLEVMEAREWTWQFEEFLKTQHPDLVVNMSEMAEGEYEGLKMVIPSWNLTCTFMPLKSEVEPGTIGTPYQDAHLRELTVNAIMYNIHTELIEDYCRGIADLEARVLRTPGPAPKTFGLDNFRLVRLVRFAATLPSFTLDESLESNIEQFVKTYIRDKRIPEDVNLQGELEKFFEDRRAEWSRAFELLARWNLLDYMFDLTGVPTFQNMSSDKVWGAGLRCLQLICGSLQQLVYSNMKIPWPSDSKFRTHNKYGIKELGALAIASLMVALPPESMRTVLSSSRLQPEVVERIMALREVAQIVRDGLASSAATGTVSAATHDALFAHLDRNSEATETRDYAIILGCVFYHMSERQREMKNFTRATGAQACSRTVDEGTLEMLETDLAGVFRGLARIARHLRNVHPQQHAVTPGTATTATSAVEAPVAESASSQV